MKYPKMCLFGLIVLVSAGCRQEVQEAEEREGPAATQEQVGEQEGVVPTPTIGDQEPEPELAPEREEPVGGATLKLESQQPYGRYLTNGDGMPLYMFEADKKGQESTCYDACAQAWPPVLATGDVNLQGQGLDKGKLGTITRRDGSKQVTYGGWPLYTYVKDSKGQVRGQDVHGFGGEWYLVGPEGSKIEATKQQ